MHTLRDGLREFLRAKSELTRMSMGATDISIDVITIHLSDLFYEAVKIRQGDR
jgi:hypothetical protein